MQARQQKQQANKHIVRSIQKLTAYRKNLEESITDYLNSLTLNRQVISILISELKPIDENNRKELLALLSRPIFLEIQTMRKNHEFQQAELLMQQQIIDQELLFNTQILNNHLEQIDDMRKLMHDKEYSYSNITEKLNAYQQIPEEDVRTTTGSIQMIINEKMNRQMIARISHQKQQLEEKIREIKCQKQKYRDKYKQMINLIKNNVPYKKIMKIIERKQTIIMSQDQDVYFNESQLTNNKVNSPESAMHQDIKIDIKPIQKQLMRIFKKQISIKQIYKHQLLQATQGTKQIKEFNQQLLKDQKYLDKHLNYFNQKLQKLEAKYKNITHKEKIKQELILMQIDKPQDSSQSESQQSKQRQKDQNINKHQLKNGIRTMMIRSGSQPNL